MTLSVLTKDTENIFKCGIAVAPVTNWIYYDTIYTERYLGLPTPFDNAKGYQDSDLTSKARLLKGKKLLLVHGTADDNGEFRRMQNRPIQLTGYLLPATVLFNKS